MTERPDRRTATGTDEHIAYLTGLYPAISHTFILREVTALRAAGVRITTCSVNRPDAAHLIGPEERAAASTTYYLLASARHPGTLLAATARALGRPRRLASAFAALSCSGATGLKENLRQLIYLGEAVVLAHYLERNKVTRIHNQLGMASASVSRYASILAGIPFSFSLHGPDDFHDAPSRQMSAKIAAADIVACISDFSRKHALELCQPEDHTKLHIIRCGIDPAKYQRANASNMRRVLFVGRLVPAKGVSVLLEAFSRIALTFPDAVLTIIGDGAERSALEEMVKEFGLANRVNFTGSLSQERVAAQMSDADLFVLPSFAEGLPVVLMEAMAASLPVIATNVAGIPELVEDGVTGRLVTAGDVEGLTQRISEHLADPARALDMTREARTRVLKDHDMWREAHRLSRLFKMVNHCSGSAAE